MKKTLNKPPNARSRLKVKQQKQNNLANSNFPYILTLLTSASAAN